MTLLIKNNHRRSDWLKEHWFIVVVAIAAVLIALYVARFFMTHRKVPDEPRFQLTTEAMRNRFFAAQLLLEAQDKSVTLTKGEVAHQGLKQVWQQPAKTAKQSAVLLLTVSKSQEADMPAMLAWVERGGHLITFSNDALPTTSDDKSKADSTTDEAAEEALANYQLNENALLNYLAIRNVQTDDPHDFMREMMQQVEAQNSNQQISQAASGTSPLALQMTNEINLSTKALLRLPAIHEDGDMTTNDTRVGIIINTDNTRHLQTSDFFARYPNAKPLANYEWLTFQNSDKVSKISVLPTQNSLSAKQIDTLTNAVKSRPKDYLPAAEAVLDVQLGKGRLTVLNDDNIFSNPDGSDLQAKKTATTWDNLKELTRYPASLNNLDNAYLLQYLLTGREHIWLVPDIEVASLPTLLWRHLKWACIAFIIATLAAMLALPKRFGRTRSYQTDTETNIFGYFNHVGQYLWHSDQARALVNDNRIQLLERLIARYPALVINPGEANLWQRVDKNKVCEIVADEVGISRGGVALALFEDWQNERGFLQMSREFAHVTQFYHLT